MHLPIETGRDRGGVEMKAYGWRNSVAGCTVEVCEW